MAVVNAPWIDHRITRIPMQLNEFDKTTIFSIFPKEITEYKITVFPSHFVIPAGTVESPSKLTIGPSSWWKEIPESDQILEVPQHSLMMAESLVKDYCNGLLGFAPNAQPGLFFLPGDLTVKEAQAKYPQRFATANEKQRNWYLSLVNFADQAWSRTNNNPMAIGDDMRLAARELKLDTKDWLANFEAVALIKCVACGQPRNPAFPICPNCKNIVDVVKAKALGLKFVE